METHTFFLNLLIILLTARVFGEFAVRLGAPSVVGELLAGVVLGPSLLGWLELDEATRLLAEVGIILLLFEVGLDTNIRRLVSAGRKSITVALGGFAMPLVFGASLAYWLFNLGGVTALFIGGTLTATSIGITVRVLNDLNRKEELEGQIVLGAAVLDDVLGVVLMALLYDFALSGQFSLSNAAEVLIFVSLFFVLAPVAAKLISMLIRRFESASEIPGLIPTTIVSLVLFFAWLAHVVGAPELLGGFAAGLALSRRFFLPLGIALRTDRYFCRHIQSQMRPIIQLFTPIFFVMVGYSLNLHEIDWGSSYIWSFSIVFLLVAIVGKFAGVFFIEESWATRVAIGLSMLPRGEVGLVFTELGRAGGILTQETYAGMVIVIALTTLLSPFVLKWFYREYSDKLPNKGIRELRND